MNIGKNMKQVREDSGMSQKELGNVLHVTRQTVSNWENEKSYPDLSTLVEFSDHFEISLDYLLKTDMELVRRMDMERRASRKRNWVIGIMASVIILFCVCTLTAGGALRAAAFFYSPKSTFTMTYDKAGAQDYKSGVLYRITANEPVEKATGGHLYTWAVYQFGPFHFAKYHGEE